MKEKIEDKLDEILEEHISEEDGRMEFRLVVYDYMAMRGKILTLIQEERKEAVEGYILWSTEGNIHPYEVNALVKTYLSSIGKEEK